MEQDHPIAKWRKSNDLSQDELAIRLNVTRWTINRIECGERQPSIALVKKISALTGIPRSDLRPDVYEVAQ